MKSARIIVYDDWGVNLDETEVLSQNRKQVENIAVHMLKSTQDAEYVEVWNEKRLTMKFVVKKNGKVKAVTNIAHPNWGGARERAGRPSKGKLAYRNRIPINVDDDMFSLLETKGNKAAWIRQAIQEKLERESNNNQESTLEQ